MSFLSKKKEEVEKPLQPRVVFNDKLLEARVGLWSGVLFSNKTKKAPNINYYDYLDKFNIPRSVPIPSSLLKNIESEFSIILSKVGIDKTETCILDNLDIDTFSFNCHLFNAKRDVKISLRISDPDYITIEDKDTTKTYEYFYYLDGRPSELTLDSFTIKNEETVFNRDLWVTKAYFTVTSGDYSLSIGVDKPDREYCPNNYRLANEEQLQEYLLGISLPTDISELYKKVRDISLGDVSDYPEISFQVKKLGNGDEEETLTDSIILKDGKMQSFTRTKDGRTVTLDKNDNWLFTSPKLSINSSNDGKINYSLSMNSYEELVANLLVNQFPNVNEEVFEVKQLVKTIFN